MATTADGIVYPIASDFIAPLNTHLQTLAESTQDALDGRAPTTLTTYTPTFTGLTLGNGTVSAKYCKVGGIIVDEIVITFGSTTVVTGNVVINGMQPSINNAPTFCGTANLHDVGSEYYVGVVREVNSTSVEILADNASSTYLRRSVLSSTVPHTWATGDQIAFTSVRLAA